MMKPSAHRARVLRLVATSLPAALLTLGTAPRAAAEAIYGVLAGVGETDNVRLEPTDRRADTIATVGLDLTWHEQRKSLDGDISADLEYLDYLRHTYNREVAGNFLGDLHLQLVPNLLRWTVNDNFGQGVIDPAAAVTPTNRENINYLDTGPDLTLPLGSGNELMIGARYSNVYYQKSPLGSNRYSGSVGVRHELSRLSGISINVSDAAIRYDNSELNPDFNQQQAYARFDARGARTRLSIDVGYDRLKLQHGSDSGPLVRLEATRQISVSSSLTLTLGHDFSEAADSFRLLQALGGASLATQPAQSTANPFKQDYGTLGWEFKRSRTAFGLNGSYFRLSYIGNATLDERRAGGSAYLTRSVTPTVELGVSADYTHDRFTEQNSEFSQWGATAQLTWRAGSMLSLITELTHSRRASTVGSADFIDNRAWVKLRYGRPPKPPGSPGTVPALPSFPSEPHY
jgi:hypothetical protein